MIGFFPKLMPGIIYISFHHDRITDNREGLAIGIAGNFSIKIIGYLILPETQNGSEFRI